VLNLSNHLTGTGYLTDAAAVGFFLAALAASVAAGLLYYRLVEYPIYRVARRMTYRR
jgi:peptidoglycan/LPS O-acetylase OafA/YrhL